MSTTKIRLSIVLPGSTLCKPATQVISLSEEAYNYFVDPFSTPYKFKGVWKSLTKNQKVQWHCQQIAEAMGGKLESFVILE